MNIKIWDDHNKQWLEPMTLFFGKDSTPYEVRACIPGEDPLEDGWYNLQGDDLSKIAIVGDISHNTHLLPEKHVRILCAAIWFDDGEECAHQPLNIGTGTVLCGWRHGSIFPQTRSLVRERALAGVTSEVQGFITSDNRFVDREEAAEIAFNAGQISSPKKELYSEDLY